MYEDIEAVLDEHVRPLLRTHGGEMEIIEVEDGVVRFKLKGKCARLSGGRSDHRGADPDRADRAPPRTSSGRCWCRISARSCWTRHAPS